MYKIQLLKIGKFQSAKASSRSLCAALATGVASSNSAN